MHIDVLMLCRKFELILSSNFFHSATKLFIYLFIYLIDTDGEYSEDNVLYTSPKSQSNLIDLIELQVH